MLQHIEQIPSVRTWGSHLLFHLSDITIILESSRCFYFSLVVMYLRISVRKIVAADGDTPTLKDKAENLSDVAKYLWLIPCWCSFPCPSFLSSKSSYHALFSPFKILMSFMPVVLCFDELNLILSDIICTVAGRLGALMFCYYVSRLLLYIIDPNLFSLAWNLEIWFLSHMPFRS